MSSVPATEGHLHPPTEKHGHATPEANGDDCSFMRMLQIGDEPIDTAHLAFLDDDLLHMVRQYSSL